MASSFRYSPAVLAAICALSVEHAAAQPQWLAAQKPGPENLRAVFFVDSLRGWVGGYSGAIYRTTTGGKSWTLQNFADTVYITDIRMLDSSRGWASSIRPIILAGDWTGSVLYSTSDGGESWNPRSYPDTLIHTLSFADELNGWAGGETGILMRTADGGQSWTPANVPPSLYGTLPVKKIRFFSPACGFAVGGYPESAGVVRRTTDGGESWSISGFGDALNDIQSIDSARLICLGGGFDDGVGVARSFDGGDTWEFQYVGPFGIGVSLALRTPSEAWGGLGFTGSSIRSIDSGATWGEIPNPEGTSSYAVQFLDDRHGYMAGDSGDVLVYNYPRPVGLAGGWNLISLPVDAPPAPVDSLFPAALSSAFAFTPGGYVAVDTLTPGIGYWLKYPEGEDEEIFGVPVDRDTMEVQAGWNMIGAISESVAASAVGSTPAGIIVSPFYSYEAGYNTAASLVPGKGYWVKVSAPGLLMLTAE